MKRAFSFVLAAIMAFTMMAGCSSKSGSSANASTGSNEKSATITFWDGNWNQQIFSQINTLWQKEHPNIKIEPNFLVDNGMSDKYTLALKNGTAPDVLACALDWTTTFGNAGLLAPLDDYIKKDKVDTSKFVKGAISASTVGGKLYALPFRSETYALFYNKDILSSAGYTKAPQTWDEVKEIAKACTKGEVSGYGVCGTNYGNYSF